MLACAYRDVVVAKIVSEGCNRREDLDDGFSLYFSIEHKGHAWIFAIPDSLEDGGYSPAQFDAIEIQLARLGMDLLPLDQYLRKEPDAFRQIPTYPSQATRPNATCG